MSDASGSDEKPTVGDMVLFDSVTWTLFGIATTTTILRLLTRRFFLHSTGADDILAFAATLILAVFVGTQRVKIVHNNHYLQAVRDGEPIKSGPVVIYHLTMVDRMSLLVGLFYTISLFFVKTAILTFYRRIVVLKQHIYMVNITRTILVLYTIAYVIAKCLAYSPVEAAWNPWDPKYGGKAKCICELLAVINSSFQVFFDILILLIPFAIFRTLKLNHNMKIGICFIYVLGLLSFSMTVVRLHLALDRDSAATFVELREKFTTFSIWTVIETTTALICANLPPMTTMLRRTYNKIVSSVGFSVGSGSGSGFGPNGEKKGGSITYFRSLRQKQSGSAAYSSRKGGPFGFSWRHGARSSNDTISSRDIKGQSVVLSSFASNPRAGNQRQSNPPLNSIGVMTDMYVDVEKAGHAAVNVYDVNGDRSSTGRQGERKDNSNESRRYVRTGNFLPSSAEVSGKSTTTVTGIELD